jgi:flagellar biosynthesis anti-sigma factor FlgM
LPRERIVKIDGSSVDGLRQALERVGGPTPIVGNSASSRSDNVQGSRDEAHFSADAQWLQATVETAKNAPDVRRDVVERMRAALDKGEVGTDAERLADALLDSWIGVR